VIENLDLRDYHLYHSIRADLLRRIGRDLEAAEAYRAAIALTSNQAERAFLENALRSVVD
jgi:RNA polymerase sigma-70 factor (ECF subfamily)